MPGTEMISGVGAQHATFTVREYDLGQTLNSGQAFRWYPSGGGWEGVIGECWVHLTGKPDAIIAQTAESCADWSWLVRYLQLDIDLGEVVATFPKDAAMQASVTACRGLRLLRQSPWECLASFILSSTKQIVQIRQIVSTLCMRFGRPLPVPPGVSPAFGFPSAETLASASESELRACKMGFRAPYLRETARILAAKEVELESLYDLTVEQARQQLIQLPGVGRKIADCVLLFAFGFQSAFPVDVWVLKALRQLYFPHRRVKPKKVRHFADAYFGPHAGYAQQYLFHYLRVASKQIS